MITDTCTQKATRKNLTLHTLSLILSIPLLGLTLTGCGGSGTDYNFDNAPPPVAPSTAAFFSPANGGPTTNNLLFGANGRLGFPNPPDANGNLNPVRSALNTLDGFSTINPITTTFGSPLDPASLSIGQSIRVFHVSRLANGAITGVLDELSSADIAASTAGGDNQTLVLTPLKPLAASSTYMVVLTNALKLADGRPVTSSSSYLILRGDNDLTQQPANTFPDLTQAVQLQALINSMENSAIAFTSANESTTDDITENDIILSWAFTTQSISTVLEDLASNTNAGTIIAAPSGFTTKDANPAFMGIADIYIGTLDIPYYLSPPSAQNPAAPITEFWQESNGLNSTPVQTSTLTIPLILTVPNASSGKTMPADGWPITIYQHGITRVRTDALIHADSLASQGIATIAIDLPLHGVTATDPATNPLAAFHASNTPFPNDGELTFNLDLANNMTGAIGSPDGNIDDSGTHFLNLASLLTSRDNIRQGVVDLIVLRKSLGNIPGVKIDTSKVGLLAHSLGGLVAVPYLAVESQRTPASLVTTGGGIARFVNGSSAFGPTIRAGLAAAAGITENADLQAFLGATQAILDSADPINYGAVAASKHPIHMIEVVGDGTAANLPDQTIPNTVPQAPQLDPEFVPPAPLSGTEPLARVMGLTSVASTASGVNGIVRFTQGEHATLLTPKKGGADAADNADLLNVFVEMHRQIVGFQASSGTIIPVTDTTIIQPVTQP